MEDVQLFFSPFHSLHLFHQFQAGCVYKKSLEGACYFLLQSVTLVFLFVFIVSVVSVEDVQFLKPFIRYTCFSSSGRLCL